MAALLAPASMLAEEVRTGKIGGLCLANKAANTPDQSSGNVAQGDSHCDLCGSLSFTAPPSFAQTVPSVPSQQVAGREQSFGLAARIRGLPPSRGPPAH